jgi:hypothetical protein
MDKRSSCPRDYLTVFIFLVCFSSSPNVIGEEDLYHIDLDAIDFDIGDDSDSTLPENTLPSQFQVIGDFPADETSERVLLEDDFRKEKESSKDSLNIDFYGQLRNEFASRIRSPREVSKLRNELILGQKADLFSGITIKAQQRYFYDSVFDLHDYFPTSVSENMRDLIEIRELVLDIPIGSLDIRVGKQQVVWGEVIGTFIADTINARDLREFILQDFDRIRIPEWAVDALYTIDETTLQLVWLPFPRMNRLAVQGAEYEFINPDVRVPISGGLAAEAPVTSLQNSEIGGRIQFPVGGLELSTFYFYGWDKTPLASIRQQDELFFLEQEYFRSHRIGGSFSKAYDSVVLKGEFVYTPRSRQQASVLEFDTTFIQTDVVEYALGADFLVDDTWRINFQFIQRILLDNYEDVFLQNKRMQSLGSVWLSKKFLDDKLEPELFMLSDLENHNAMIRPRINYYPYSHLKFSLGADVFTGKQHLLFGQFTESSRVYSELNYYF